MFINAHSHFITNLSARSSQLITDPLSVSSWFYSNHSFWAQALINAVSRRAVKPHLSHLLKVAHAGFPETRCGFSYGTKGKRCEHAGSVSHHLLCLLCFLTDNRFLNKMWCILILMGCTILLGPSQTSHLESSAKTFLYVINTSALPNKDRCYSNAGTALRTPCSE